MLRKMPCGSPAVLSLLYSPSCLPTLPSLPGLAEVHLEVKYLPCGPASSLLVNTAGLPMASAEVLGGCALQKVCVKEVRC